MVATEPEFKKDRRTKLYFVAIPIAGSKKHKWVCTGERSLTEAREAVTLLGVDRLLHLHNAQALTAESIALVTVGRVHTCADVLRLWTEWFTPRRGWRTVVEYTDRIGHFLRTTGCEQRPIAQITEQQINDWVNGGGAKRATCVVRLAAIRSLFGFASARALVVGNPAALVEVNSRQMTVEQLETTPTKPWTEEEWRRVLAGKPGPIRDWVVLSYCTGLRLIDCVCLEWASIRKDAIMVFPLKIRHVGKPTPLWVPLSDPLIGRMELHVLLAELNCLPVDQREDPTYVWPLHRLEYLDNGFQKCLRQSVANYIRRYGVVGRRFHGLRTTFAQRLQASGRTLEQIASALGHHSTETTKIYLTSPHPITAGNH